MKLGIAQIDTKVGDAPYNKRKIEEVVRELGPHCDTIVFPENTTSGYACNDLYEDTTFLRDQRETVNSVRRLVNTLGKDLTLVLGNVDYNSGKIMPNGQIQKFNAASIIQSNQLLLGEETKYYKRLLPNYDVFFERRYFTPGMEDVYFKTAQNLLATITVCEDMWDKEYEGVDAQPLRQLRNPNVDWVFNISSSPFRLGALQKRFEIIQDHVKRLGAGFVYVNQSGAQDELVFDGGSMVMDKNGKLIHFGKTFSEDLQVVDTDKDNGDKTHELLQVANDKYGNILQAQVAALDGYLMKTGLRNVVIGLSGGIDSALSLYLLSKSKVLKKENIHAIYMPTQFSKSFDDAQAAARLVGVELKNGAIDPLVKAFEEYALNAIGQKLEGLSHENIQASIRGDILMTYSRLVNGVVINNSNKTELLLGYGTIYGDLIGFLSLIGDLNKREIFEYSRWINNMEGKEVIPNSIINRKPSAELKEDQVDPFDYEKVSDAVDELGFGGDPLEVSLKYGLDLKECEELKKLVRRNEFKKPPLVVKLKQRSKGIGRLYPVVS